MDRRQLRLVPEEKPSRPQANRDPGFLGMSQLETRALLAVLAAAIMALVLYDVGVLFVYDIGV